MHAISLVGWLLLACTRTAVADEGVVEVDLIFPRNETYAPTPVFPIIFAIQNAELARSLNPRISFEVWEWINRTTTVVVANYDLRYHNFSSSEPYFAYRPFLKFNKEGIWAISWSVTWYNCTEESLHSETSFFSNQEGNGLIFATKNGSQEMDLVSATASQNCPSEDRGGTGPAINITDTLPVNYWKDWDGGESCAVVAPTPATPSPCQVQIDSVAAASISASMTSVVCSIASFTTLPISCPIEDNNENSAAQPLTVGGVAGLAAALGALGYYMMF